MAEGKRYYWLKLKDDFFSSKRIKKLRKMAGGNTYTIIYLKLQLLAMKHDGIINFSGLEDSVAAELALDLDEQLEDVQVTLMYLLSCGLAETSDNVSFFFPYAAENVGSEGASAQRWREWKARQVLVSNAAQTQCKQITNGEKEIEKEKEKEIEIEIENREEYGADKPPRKRFEKPSVDDVRAYCQERGNNVDPVRFCDYYDSNGWKVGKNPMKDWKAAVRTWERSDSNGSANKSVPAAAPDHDQRKPAGSWFHYDN